MIIDSISERREDIDHNIHEYDAQAFFRDLLDECEVGTKIAKDILFNMAFRTEDDVKSILCYYIDYNKYNPAIKDFINSVNWTVSDNYDKVEAC